MRPRERRFVVEYMRHADAGRAARAAGYKPNRARHRGLALLAKPEIRAAIERLRADRAFRLGLTQDRVLLEYARLALSDLGRILAPDAAGARPLPLLALHGNDTAAIAWVRFGKDGGIEDLGLHDKNAALEVLGRYFNVFDAEAWRDDSDGARDQLLERLRVMAAAADGEAPAAEAHPAGEMC